MKVKSLSCVRLFATLWTVAYQAPPSMGFSRQEYWSGLPFPSPGDLPNPGIEPGSPALEADALTSGPLGKPKEEGLPLPGDSPWAVCHCQQAVAYLDAPLMLKLCLGNKERFRQEHLQLSNFISYNFGSSES